MPLEHQLGEYRRRIAEATRIPRSIRSAILTRLEHYGVSAAALGREFLTREGYCTGGGYRANEYTDRIGELYGSDEKERMLVGVAELAERDTRTLTAPAGGWRAAWRRAFRDNFPRYVVVAGPDAEFLKCLGCAMGMIGHRHAEAGSGRGDLAIQQAAAQIDELFAKRGIPYRFDDTALVWAADGGLQRVIVDSALDGLADPRLAGARSEFEAAVGHLRAGTQQELEDAIQQAATSVDSALKVLAGQTGTQVAANATVQTLFDALTTAGHLPHYTANLINTASRIRDDTGAHGAGAPRRIELDIATAAVNAAATALVFLAGRLP